MTIMIDPGTVTGRFGPFKMFISREQDDVLMATYGSTSQVIIDVPRRIAVGVTTDFSVTFKAGSRAGAMVTGVASFPQGTYTAWFWDTSTSAWVEFNSTQDPDTEFGPSSGFPLQDATSYFRVRFEEVMQGTFTARMKEVSTGSYLAQDSVTVNAVVGETMDELNLRIADANGAVIKLETDIAGTMSIGGDVTIDGDGHTLHGNIVLDATSDTVPYSVVIQNLVMREDSDSTSAQGFGIFGQNQTADTPVKPVDLVVRDCCISGYSKKGIYLTNVRNFNMSSCIVGNVATEPMDDPNTFGDYAVDLNLCGVQDGLVKIVGNTFTGSCGAIGAVKVTQRGGVGLTDDVNTDILNPVSAFVRGVTVAGNDFSAMNASRQEGVSDIVLGSSPNSDGTARTYNNSYPAEIGATGETFLNIRGSSSGDMTFTMQNGSTVSLSSVRSEGKTYAMSIDTSDGVEFTGTLRDGAAFGSEYRWDLVEGGPCGIGMLGFRRLVMKDEGMRYVTGGFTIPVSNFLPMSVVVNMTGGGDAFYDPDTERILLYRNGTELAMDTVIDSITVLVFGK